MSQESRIDNVEYFEYKGYFFAPVRRTNFKFIPYGYKPPEKDSEFYYPDVDKIPFLVHAFEFLNNGGSLRDASNWLLDQTGKKISHQGLNLIWKKYHPGDNARKAKNEAILGKRTPEDRKRIKKNYYKAAQKRRITLAQRRLDKVEQEEVGEDRPMVPVPGGTSPGVYEYEEIPKELNIVFKPNPGPQTDFLAATETEVLYGGSAGGEPKTWFDRLLLQ